MKDSLLSDIERDILIEETIRYENQLQIQRNIFKEELELTAKRIAIEQKNNDLNLRKYEIAISLLALASFENGGSKFSKSYQDIFDIVMIETLHEQNNIDEQIDQCGK